MAKASTSRSAGGGSRDSRKPVPPSDPAPGRPSDHLGQDGLLELYRWMLLTRRLERARLRPTGFVATDYSIAVWGTGDLGAAFADNQPSLAELFDEDSAARDAGARMPSRRAPRRTTQPATAR